MSVRPWRSRALVTLVFSALLAAGWWWSVRGQRAPSAVRSAHSERARWGLQFELTESEASISGSVTDAAHHPVAEADVCAHIADDASTALRAGVCTRSDAQGTYRLKGLSPQS